ncbi:MAG: tyrosine-type recombinase/integrase [Flavobacteriaceae bacterium]|nr:tyrosine-type recombinase/integrase [Flavobacteriaceae bacterium]
MKHTFYLRKPKDENETLILFSCYFNDEKKQFVYSTRQSILPLNWDFKNNQPKNRGKNIAQNHLEIKRTLNQFVDEFYSLQSRCIFDEMGFTSYALKQHFNKAFGYVERQETFFEVYDKFMEEKIKLKEWKKSTAKRYYNIKRLLLEFEKKYKYKLTFGRINKAFYREFTDYCYEYKNHYSNTFNRNIGLIKTFLLWAVKNEFTFNQAFIDFKKPPRVLTREETLTKNDILKIYKHKFDDEILNQIKDIFVFQCLTGMRFGELKTVSKRTVKNNCVLLKEEKDSSKPTREVPLTYISNEILLKYDYKLPILSNQKHNDYLKEILKKTGFTNEVEYTRTKGVEQKTFVKKFYERISTHTARRSFITIMRNEGIADKTIMSISGHKDFKTFNMYHQVNNVAKITAIRSVFGNL